MQIPLQVTFRDMPQSDAVETRIREKADKLERYYDRIMACRVVVEMPQRHKHQGKLHSVRIDLTVPGAELVANHALHEDVYIAIREAFDAMQRQLEDYARRQRGEVKNHAQAGPLN
ncbi:MAG: ribosomal subunit interface protein [Candidatus Muproteobacteria bacterium RBG_16_65_34]|uniref:Ribosomal subunit interface protein n=1 Tax=Candidatus Muproteobacteria bacterium RBG_16_65_34 TaxID=1817760 RepID=A0A1F6TLL2_9PROT|nr:MAG: ribosomal subunit interface protein [Candidatus Muproteobacteria bacterium RBG_16_65_34]